MRRVRAPNGPNEASPSRVRHGRGARLRALAPFVGLGIACAWLVVATPARAQTSRRVLVVRAAPASADAAAALGARLIERAAARGDDVTLPPPPAAHEGGVDALAEATLRADEAYASLALAEAERALAGALGSIDAEGPAARQALVEALLLSSMVHDATGDARGAEDAARRALIADPDLAIDLTRYPPTLAARIDALRGTLARCAISLRREEPADASLRIDGEAAPTPPSELPCGTHWVWAESAGRTPVRRRITLVDGGAPVLVSFTLPLDPAQTLASLGGPGTPIDPMGEHAAALLGRELWVLDVTPADGGGLRATLGARTVALGPTASVDAIVDALLAPVVVDDVDEVAIGVGVGLGGAALVTLAIVLGVVLSPQAPPGWVGSGEIVVP